MERGQGALNLGLRWQSPPEQAPSSAPTPSVIAHFPCTSSFYNPSSPSQPENSHSFWAKSWSGSSLGHLEFGSGTPVFAGTRHPEHTGHPSEGEYFLWVLHLPTDPRQVASVRSEVTRLSSWASQGFWRSLSHRCSDLPLQRGRQCHQGEGELQS